MLRDSFQNTTEHDSKRTTMDFELPDPLSTDQFGECLAKMYLCTLKKKNQYIPLTLLLDGDVGAGKSCIARALIKYLTSEETVPSPSYLISLSYNISFETNENQQIKIHHIDPYRLKSTQKIEQLLPINDLINHIVILEHSQKTNIIDMFDSKNVIKVQINGKKIINTSELGIETVSSRNLTSMGRSLTVSVALGSVYNLSDLSYLFLNTSSELKCTDASDELKCTDARSSIFKLIKSTPGSMLAESERLLFLAFKNTQYRHKQLIETIQHKITDLPTDVLIMGVETSCDDTCISIINGHGDVIVDYQIGQNDVHMQYGGVHPMYAKQAHQANLEIYMDKALNDIKTLHGRYPDAIAYTVGPGLEVCLVAGIMKTHEVSCRYNIPLIPTHHMESHIMVCRLPSLGLNVQYPFVCCVISGGHTFIVYVEAEGVYELLSTTVDDSMGETIDKVGRELGLKNIPAGKDFEQLALSGDPETFTFPRPSIKTRPYDMSFSGLKFCGVSTIKKNIEIPNSCDTAPNTPPNTLKQTRADIAASFQESLMEYIISQFKKVYLKFLQDKKVNCIVLAGGVASNLVLRTKMEALSREIGIPTCYPPPKFCTDNGVMVAWNGYEKLRTGFLMEPIRDYDPTVRCEARARWKLWKS